MEIINSGSYFSGTIEPEGLINFEIEVPEATAELKLALSWNDPAANPGDAVALVNDLDMTLQNASGEEWLPWVLNSEARLESLLQAATRGRDSLNPVEMISITDPASGRYTLKISAEELSGAQAFHVAYVIEPKNELTWTFPTSEDAFLTGEENIIRWTETFSAEQGRLEYKMENSDWQVLSDNIDLDSESFTWKPEAPGKGKLRLVIEDRIIESENFAIAPEPLPQLLFNCENDFMLGWSAVTGADKYIIQSLGEKYMEDVMTVQATSAFLEKELFKSDIWAVVPVFDGVEGVQGKAIDIDEQGVLCHYRNFFALLEEKERVLATLNLSKSPIVEQVQFFRKNDGQKVLIGTFFAPFPQEALTVEDKELRPGDNSYSAVILLKDGTEVTVEPIELFIPGEDTFIAYPNPVRSGEDLHLITKGDDLQFEIFDMSGRKISDDTLIHYSDRIEMRLNSKGVFVVRASRSGKVVAAKKIIVQ
jgi:hypothetical protein